MVTPVAPTLSEVQCGIKPEVVLPTTEGIVYSQTEDGDTVTVTATAADGYVLSPGSVTSYTLDTRSTPCPCTFEDIPEFNESEFPVSGIVYEGFVTDLPEAWLAGLAEREATFTYTTVTILEAPVTFFYQDPVSGETVGLETKNYSTDIITTGSASTISGPTSVSFASVASTGQSIDDLIAADLTQFETQYPNAEISYIFTGFSSQDSSSITVTAKGDCGEDQIKEYYLGGGGGGGGLSDVRLKTNVTLLDTFVGFNIYSWNYTFDPSGQKYVGVIAQEVMTTHPHSVYLAADGFYRVRYDVLGLRMLTLEQYEAGESLLTQK